MNQTNKAVLILMLLVLGFYIGSKIEENNTLKIINKKNEEVVKIIEENRVKELTHKMREDQLLNQYLSLKQNYEETIDNINSDYNDRLRIAENRVHSYKRQAENRPDCSPYIEHAAKLDKSLEEGRYLVKELSQIIRFNEQQLKIMKETITNDRELLK